MANNNPAPSQRSRPVLLILLGITLVVATVMLRSGAQNSKQNSTAVVNHQELSNHRENAVPEQTVWVEQAQSKENQLLTQLPRRNPFYPPASIWGQLVETRNETRTGQTAGLPGLVADHSVETPAWKGIMGDSHEKLVLINFQNKNHILQVGDWLPGSDYRVLQADLNTVTLQSTNGRLTLKRGKEQP